MRLPYAERAEVDLRKLREYCLDPLHPEGKHKARVFASALGMTADDAEALRGFLLKAVHTTDVELGYRDRYGQRFTLDVSIEWRERHAIIRSGWILEHGSNVPRLTSCYVL